MANILTSYPIRYTQDEAHFGASGLVISNSTNYIDLSNADNVTGFTFNTSQPTGTDIRMLFKTNDTWFKLDANGAAVEVDTQDLTAESVLEEGNSVAELDALTSIPAFVNSRVHFAVALSSDDPDNSKPRINFSVNGLVNQNNVEITVDNNSIDVQASTNIAGININYS